MTRKTKKLIYNIIACILLLGAISWVCEKFIHLGNVEFTENAQVKQHIIPVNSRVQGYIKEVRFDEYTKVQKGDTLVIIEDAEYRYMVAQAEANLENAKTGKVAMHNVISTTASNLSVTDASIEEARIVFENAERNYKRFSTLYEQNAVTRQQYDDMNTTYLAAKARYDMLRRQKESVQSVSREQNTRLGQNEAGIKLAEAALELARLNLSYTVVLAPCDGYTGRKEIQEGQLIQPGQTLVDVVDAEQKWVVANYKETQTANIREGQEVEIEIDAVPNHTFKGVVRSVSRATGASFSLMPQDNSSGNFVKIEQRIPVRIDFAEDNDAEAMERVSAGMNGICSSLTTITFPSTLKSIEDKAFNGCNFKSVVSLATVPAVCPDESYIYDLLFEFRTYNHAPLYIPEGKYWDYAFAPGWGEFIHIKEIAMDDSELEDSKAYMIADTKGCNYTVYNAEKGTLTNVEYTHSLDEENEGSCWTVLREAGKSYLYNLGAKKFACMDKEGELSLAEAPVALDITSTENGLSINGNNRMFVLNKNINVDATGIEDIRIDNAQTEGVDIYYLDGRRMNKSVRGVNIVNGRKVVVK